MVQIVLGIFDILSVCRVNAFLTLDLGTKVSINILRLFFVFVLNVNLPHCINMYKCKVMSKIVSEKNALRKRGKFKNIRVHTLLIVCSSFYSKWCQLGSLHVQYSTVYA